MERAIREQLVAYCAAGRPVVLATVLDDYGLEHMQELGHSNTCVNRVVVDDGRARAELQNCTAHLASAEASASA